MGEFDKQNFIHVYVWLVNFVSINLPNEKSYFYNIHVEVSKPCICTTYISAMMCTVCLYTTNVKGHDY